ncbi:YmfQ family protein [Clostridium beijerinckii]|uniref:YmfQ family protein n=1 Tax=Clostridium beijerinckii TaxID=1520 RepID=UPI00098C0479|nr:YmfQ family protein [Clostridium beijerinckii]MBA8937275.1 uncharacterized protein YmfQ (DUF2313 family) [Clostridium beijerinckii]NRU40259.1 hypothetical protein [Clostridium beijerinckii]NSA96464.1 uncharacterized protein YmfQ (DUF2313 family) [Clostridium beijerinckii]OOM60631.1 hypothetical protein CLOBI_29190 [Clostridium beijerinckii]OOM68553.1 hypothetical protein CLBEIC_32100 [Clostridium beijerinckii]
MYGSNQYGLVKYAENTMTPVDIEKYKIDLTKYVPPFVIEIPEMKASYDVQGTELGGFLYYSDDVKNQLHIDTAAWGLVYWEERYGIETNLDLSYEQRREMVKAKKRGQGTTTMQMIKNVAEVFSGGEVNVIENTGPYIFTIQFVGVKGIPRNMQAFINMLEDIKPAHLGYEFKYTYTVWSFLKEKKLTWNNSKAKTWDQLKVYE